MPCWAGPSAITPLLTMPGQDRSARWRSDHGITANRHEPSARKLSGPGSGGECEHIPGDGAPVPAIEATNLAAIKPDRHRDCLRCPGSWGIAGVSAALAPPGARRVLAPRPAGLPSRAGAGARETGEEVSLCCPSAAGGPRYEDRFSCVLGRDPCLTSGTLTAAGRHHGR